MDIVKEEVVVNDPSTGTTQASQSVQEIASPQETKVAKADKKNQVVWYIIGIIDTLLILRIIFLLLGANNVGFASVLYSITDPFVSLFKGIFSSATAGSAYFDSASVLALIIITLLGWGIVALIDVAGRPAPSKA